MARLVGLLVVFFLNANLKRYTLSKLSVMLTCLHTG